MRPAGAGHDPEIDLGLAEPGRLGGDDEVARHRKLAAAAEAETGNGSDERRAHTADRVPALDAAVLVQRHGRSRRQLGDVRAGRERALVPADDDAANRLVLVELLQSYDELLHQRTGERIELLRTVEQHDRDRSGTLYEDERFRNAFTASWASSPSIDSASQSRAWFTVSCHERSRQKLSCCFA